jgi:hypothetical protein
MAALSPYHRVAETQWPQKTKKLVEAHPLKAAELVEVVLQSWNGIFESKLGPKGFQIGIHIIPKPQIMGFLLHELISLEFATRYPKFWRGEQSSSDKDLVYIPDEQFSVEIKTSSDKKNIYGNRSFAQKSEIAGKKSKSGYYLQVNFDKFSKTVLKPEILLIKFGWLDHTDWIGQTASTGQQARLSPATANNKLLTIYQVK